MGSRGGSVRDGARRGARGWRRPAAPPQAVRLPLLSLLLALVASAPAIADEEPLEIKAAVKQ